MKVFLSLVCILVIGCAAGQVQEVGEGCNRMLWRPGLEKAVPMTCLGDHLWNDAHTEIWTRLVAEAYHPTDKTILYTFWDNNNDCIADFAIVYAGEKYNTDQYLYKTVDLLPVEIALIHIQNTEEKHGVKVLREVDCPKK